MPLTIDIPGKELFDQKTNRFIVTKPTTITLEHSLLSISKWESKWHKPYFSRETKSEEEALDYIRCMCLTPNVDINVFRVIDSEGAKKITDYIQDPMTATTIHQRDKKSSREIITNELIYYWMADFGIPFDPCQKWHINRLFTLIQVASAKNQPSKKMSRRDMLNERNLLNAQRRAKYNSRG